MDRFTRPKAFHTAGELTKEEVRGKERGREARMSEAWGQKVREMGRAMRVLEDEIRWMEGEQCFYLISSVTSH